MAILVIFYQWNNEKYYFNFFNFETKGSQTQTDEVIPCLNTKSYTFKSWGAFSGLVTELIYRKIEI